MFGFWNSARANKENIFYAIVTIVLLERVRCGWNRADTAGRRDGLSKPQIERRQRNLVVKAALLYALLLVLPVVKYIFRSIDELSWTVQGLTVLKNMWVFLAISLLTEGFLAIVIYNLLRVYVDRMNAAIGFFTKIGRNIWDGSKSAVQMSSSVGSRVAGGVRALGGKVVGGVWGVRQRVVTRSRGMSEGVVTGARGTTEPAAPHITSRSSVLSHVSKIPGVITRGGAIALSRFRRQPAPMEGTHT
jgi:hypothetical protein